MLSVAGYPSRLFVTAPSRAMMFGLPLPVSNICRREQPSFAGIAIRKARHTVSRTAGLYPGIDAMSLAQFAWLQHWFGSCTPTRLGGRGMSPTKLKDISHPAVLKTLAKSSTPPPEAGTDAGGLSAPCKRKMERVARRKDGLTHWIESEPRSVAPCISLP